jgi:Surfeit locus protein 6/60S ribosome biogenesis protein Rrp14
MGKKRAAAIAADQTVITSPLDLKSLIHEHSLFFDQLVGLIPARFFLPYSSDDKPWFPGLSKKEKEKFKEQTRENIIKSRRDRLDPTRSVSSTLDLLKKSLDEEKELSCDENEEEDARDREEEEEEEEVEAEKEVERAQSNALLTDERPVTYEELQRRLRKRIAELSAGRNTRPEAQLKQERRKEVKNKKKPKIQTKKNKENETASAGNADKRKREDGKDEIFMKRNKKNKVGEPTDVIFGQVRIDGKENKRKKRLSKENELKRAKRLEELKKDPEKGKKVSWKAAVTKAAGEKVHDDPKLLKQSIKKEKKRQVKSKIKWREREETVAKAKAEKQSKRAGNIKERIHQKKMSKIEKREKKLMSPGFEGKKVNLMNKLRD